MQKVRKLTLSYSPDRLSPNHPYKVIKIQHTTEYNPGDFLSKAQVDELNVSRHWDVTIVEGS